MKSSRKRTYDMFERSVIHRKVFEKTSQKGAAATLLLLLFLVE